MLKKHVVVDGSNIATEGRNAPSLTQLDEAVRAFLSEHPSEQATIIVDATFGHRIHESEQDAFEEAVDAGELLTAPAGTIGRGDAFILEVADKADATVVSNDSFQEFHGKYTWLFDEGRLVGGKPVPGVGWVFLLRSPVRGPISRRAVQEARGGRASRDARGGKGAKATQRPPAKKSGAKKNASSKRTGKKNAPTLPDDRKTTEAIARAAADDGSGARKRARQPLEPLNDPLPFIEFVAAHPVGTTVEGEVEQFSSHGAYVTAAGARCYVPLKLMGDPAPKSAKEILRVGEAREFVVFSIDPPRRGIDLALTTAGLVTKTDNNMPADQQEQAKKATKRSRARGTRGDTRRSRDKTAHAPSRDDTQRAFVGASAKTNTSGSTLATNTRADQRAEEAPVTPARKRKAAAKKRPAKKRAAKRTAKKRATKKRATKRSPARKKKAAAKKRPAKRRATKKRATKKRATKKRATKKRATKKRATKKRATKKRATKKRASKKRAAKRPAKKRAAKRTAKKRSTRRRR